jgi:hypothetical protein
LAGKRSTPVRSDWLSAPVTSVVRAVALGELGSEWIYYYRLLDMLDSRG